MFLKRTLFLTLLLISFVTVAQPSRIYDSSRDALSDYKNALISASSVHKNIFVIAGGNWCIYCHELEKNLKESSLDLVLENNFILMKANFGDGNANEGFFTLFPKFNSFPHILIISPEGQLLESTNVASEDEFKSMLVKYTINETKP